MKPFLHTAAKYLMLISVMVLPAACAPTPAASSMEVAAAYESSGIIPTKPYTRTIFSSTNW